MSGRALDQDEYRRRTYDYSNRRDGERDREAYREGYRDRGDRDRDRDRDRDYRENKFDPSPRDQYAKNQTQRTAAHSSPAHGTSVPTSARPGSAQEQTQARPVATTSPKSAPSHHSSDAAKRLVEFGEHIVDRTVLKIQRDQLASSAKRRKIEYEKTKHKHADFPSIPDIQKRVQERDDKNVENLDRQLKQIEPQLIKSAEEFARSQVTTKVADNTSVEKQIDARICALFDMKKKEMEEMVQFQIAALRDEETQKRKKVELDVERLQKEVAKEKGHRMRVDEENMKLKRIASEQSQAIEELRRHVAEKREDTVATPIQAVEPQDWAQTKALAEKHEADIDELLHTVNEHTVTLGDLDLEQIIAACDATTTKIPALQQKLQKLENQSEEKWTQLRNATGGLEKGIQGLKDAQRSVIEKFGAMIDGIRKEVALKANSIPPSSDAAAHSSPDLALDLSGLDTRIKVLERDSQEEAARSQSWTSKFAAIEPALQAAIESNRESQAAIFEQVHGAKAAALAQANDLAAARQIWDQKFNTLKQSFLELQDKLQGKLDLATQQLVCLDDQYNNLTSEDLTKTFLAVLDQYHPNHTQLGPKLDAVIAEMRDFRKRLGSIERHLLQPPAQPGESSTHSREAGPSRKRKQGDLGTNGHHHS